MRPDISIVIPVFNEAVTLPQLLAGIETQTLAPSEVIVVDAGSSDGSISIVEQWATVSGLGGPHCRVILNPGGMPGANRNRGVAEARGEWVAFIDAGIVPEPDWLERLWKCVMATSSRSAWGRCRFDAESAFEKAVCALSYGCRATHPVLPASLFHRSVFERVGSFREDLCAAEDLVWLRSFEQHFGPRQVCQGALVHYRHFPRTVNAVARKWCLYEEHVVRAGLGGSRGWLLLTGLFGLLLIGLITSPTIGLVLLLGYLFARGIIDPMRRSHAWHWWGDRHTAVLVAPGIGLTTDLAKVVGGLVGSLRNEQDGLCGEMK